MYLVAVSIEVTDHLHIVFFVYVVAETGFELCQGETATVIRVDEIEG